VRALITTTINVPGNLADWRETLNDDDDVVIVAGDVQSPHDDIVAYLAELPGTNTYLHPDAQGLWESSEAIGWRCIQRRNIALLEALRYKPEFIVSVDDDNYPMSYAMAEYTNLFAGHTVPPQVKSPNGWFNPGVACSPQVVHRGYPLWLRGEYEQVDISTFSPPTNVGVVASLWIGDPDIDAIERMYRQPVVRSVSFPQFMLRRGTWAPFNSQATAIRGDLAPAFFMWPGVGRYDDIWASYLMRAIMDARNDVVAYGEPLVRQVRNEHDLFKDLDAELFGMRHNIEVVKSLRHIKSEIIAEMSVTDALTVAFDHLANLSFIPTQTITSWSTWLRDLITVEEMTK
jgi:hypothetical protein